MEILLKNIAYRIFLFLLSIQMILFQPRICAQASVFKTQNLAPKTEISLDDPDILLNLLREIFTNQDFQPPEGFTYQRTRSRTAIDVFSFNFKGKTGFAYHGDRDDLIKISKRYSPENVLMHANQTMMAVFTSTAENEQVKEVLASSDLGYVIAQAKQFYKNENLENAEKCFLRALEIDPRNTEAMNGMGNVLVDQDICSEAEEWFDRVLEVDHYNSEAYKGKAAVELVRGYYNSFWSHCCSVFFIDADNKAVTEILLRRQKIDTRDEFLKKIELLGKHIYSHCSYNYKDLYPVIDAFADLLKHPETPEEVCVRLEEYLREKAIEFVKIRFGWWSTNTYGKFANHMASAFEEVLRHARERRISKGLCLRLVEDLQEMHAAKSVEISLDISAGLIKIPKEHHDRLAELILAGHYDIVHTGLITLIEDEESFLRLSTALSRWSGRERKLQTLWELLDTEKNIKWALTAITDSNFSYEDAKLIALRILESGVTTYINTLKNLLAKEIAEDPKYEVFRKFFTNNARDLEVRMRAAEDYIEMMIFHEMTEENKEAYEGIAAAFESALKEMDAYAEEMMEGEPTISQERTAEEKMRKSLNRVRGEFLRKLLEVDELEDFELELLGDPQILKQMMTLLSVLLTLELSYDFQEGDLAREIMKRALTVFFEGYENRDLSQAKQALNEFVINLGNEELNEILEDLGLEPLDQTHKCNKEIIEELTQAGYKKALFTDGITKTVHLPTSISAEDKKDSIRKSAEEIVELAITLGITTLGKRTLTPAIATELGSSEKILQFWRQIETAYVKDKKTRSLFEVHEKLVAKRMEYVRKIEALPVGASQAQDFRITIKKDLIEEACVGMGDFNLCYSPDGVHRATPIVHGLEANSFVLQVFNQKGQQVANAVLILGTKGVYVYTGYSADGMDADHLFAEGLAELAKYVPGIFLSKNSAGYKTFSPYGVTREGRMEIIKKAAIFDYQYVDDFLETRGDIIMPLENPLEITEEVLKAKGFYDTLFQTESEPAKAPDTYRDVDWTGLFQMLKSGYSNAYLFLIGALKARAVKEGFSDDEEFLRGWLEEVLTERSRKIKEIDPAEAQKLAAMIHDFLKKPTIKEKKAPARKAPVPSSRPLRVTFNTRRFLNPVIEVNDMKRPLLLRTDAPGFIHAGVEDEHGNWTAEYDVELVKTAFGKYEALLEDPRINRLTFFWYDDEGGHWQGEEEFEKVKMFEVRRRNNPRDLRRPDQELLSVPEEPPGLAVTQAELVSA
ncbi:MAG: hypothetical protein JW774_08005 [Candidatus Aureabacteria bacterium]|nr:hypothetical protein [Candidatus Auribacterota bacterium]